MQMDRRSFLKLTALSSAGAMLSRSLAWAEYAPGAATPAPAVGGRSHFTRRITMARFPEKRSLILLTDRPPQLETPISIFKQDITPNDAFFVRWHESAIPTAVDLRTFRLTLGGHVARPLSFSVEDLRKNFEPISFQAVGQCSGNSRGFFQPRVAGGEWGNGAVGNAKWTGVRLKDLLAKANVKPDPVDVTFAGLDEAPLSDTPKFVKSLEFDHANDGEVIVAYAMNDAPLPMLNGFPLRLVVPGWFATYWVKSLHQINVLPEKFEGFWMAKAYRIPATPDGNESPEHLAEKTVPITRHTVRSLIVSPEARQVIRRGQNLDVQGVAFDAGEGITRVEVSTDGGVNWSDARLDPQADRYAWRRFHHAWTPATAGTALLMSRATNGKGETQVTSQWNRSGYQRNVIERINVNVT
jgi:DMSO/TMAO reductase YedYZ molybdopterin-dependent catalytic subunit